MFLNTFCKIFSAYIILLYIIHFASALKNYDRYKVYQVRPTTINQLNYISKLSLNEGLDALTFTRHINQSGNFLVVPKEQITFERLLQTQGIQYHVAVNNVTNYLVKKGILHQNTDRKRAAGKIDFNNYQRMSDIDEYLKSLAQKYPKKVKVKTRGKSYEGRPIKTIFISRNKKRKKPIIFIDAGIHAREWMAPASALYIIHMLVENVEQSGSLLKDYDFLILPVVNPDGYEYTHTNDRLWRKTRSKQAYDCYGVDGNRNFAFHWAGKGTSNNPCANIYHGPKAFSEVETQIVRDIMLGLSRKAIMYLSLHAYGSYILYPWGYDDSILPENWEDIHAVAEAGANEVMRVHKSVYEYGSSAQVLYEAAGGSDDYALGVANIPFSFTMEVQDDGFGFDPPPEKIPSVTQESWTCIKAMIEYLKRYNIKLRSLRRKSAKQRLVGTRIALTLPLAELFLFRSIFSNF